MKKVRTLTENLSILSPSLEADASSIKTNHTSGSKWNPIRTTRVGANARNVHREHVLPPRAVHSTHGQLGPRLLTAAAEESFRSAAAPVARHTQQQPAHSAVRSSHLLKNLGRGCRHSQVSTVITCVGGIYIREVKDADACGAGPAVTARTHVKDRSEREPCH